MVVFFGGCFLSLAVVTPKSCSYCPPHFVAPVRTVVSTSTVPVRARDNFNDTSTLAHLILDDLPLFYIEGLVELTVLAQIAYSK